jgi:hypothetical protein
MSTCFDFLPVLALGYFIARVTIVHQRCYRQLRRTCEAEGRALLMPKKTTMVYAWSFLQPDEMDTVTIRREKERLLAEVRSRLRYCGVLALAWLFGLGIVGAVLGSLFR